MKKLIFSTILLLSIISCQKDDDETVLDRSTNFIVFKHVEPDNGSVFTVNSEVYCNFEYNIAPNELEELGFYLSYYEKLGTNAFFHAPKKTKLTTRQGEIVNHIPIYEQTIERLRGDTVWFFVALTRKYEENRATWLTNSDTLMYLIK